MTNSTPPNAIASTPDGEIHELGLGTYVLTEFVFCLRAGLCAHETGREEDEDLPPLSFFSFNPLYSLPEIEASLQQAVNEMTWYLGGAALSAVLAVILSLWFGKLVGVAGAFGMLWFFAFALQRGIDVLRLNKQRKDALAGKHKEPNPNLPDVQDVHWWDLLQAGFESHPVQDRLIDSELNFWGKPFRYLRRGNVIIPVWRMRHYDGRLHPQNFVRMAAYCHLVQKSFGAGAQSPFGIILFGHSLDGVAIPFTPQRRSDFVESLRSAQTWIAKIKDRDEPKAPDRSLCARCPYGKPKAHVPNESEHVCAGKPLPVKPAYDANDKCFHSLCGDRFRWLALHEDVEKMDLRTKS